MKLFSAVLSVSIVANLALFGLVVLKRPAPVVGLTTEKVTARDARPTSAVPASAKISAGNHAHGAAGRAKVWEELRHASLPEMAKRLRTMGFPQKMVVAIVSQAADERIPAELKEPPPEVWANRPYWKPYQDLSDDPKKRDALRKFQHEQQAALTEALGENYWFTDEMSAEMTTRRFGDLPDDKRRALMAVEKDYRDLQTKIFEEARTSEDAGKLAMKKLRLLESEQRADIAKLLTPEELFEFDVRSSPGARKLRDDTALLQLSEAEFRALVPGYQSAMDQLQSSDPTSVPERQAVMRAAEGLMEAKAREILSPDRFADFMQAKDPTSKKLNLIVQRLDLPLSAARAVVAVQDDVTQRADAIRTDKALSDAQRAAQFAALSQEAATKIAGSLGQRGYAAYLENSGKWLKTLQNAGDGSKPAR